MSIVRRIAATVQALLGTWADEVNQRTHVIQRQRKFYARTLARTFVLGFLGVLPQM